MKIKPIDVKKSRGMNANRTQNVQIQKWKVKLKPGFRPDKLYSKQVNEDSDAGNEADRSQALSQYMSEKKEDYHS